MSIRSAYQTHGVRAFYQQFGAEYRNPHEDAIRAALREAARVWALDLGNVLDLACGSGEVTLALRELGAVALAGIDPFTAEAYRARTGEPAETFTFEQIAAGALEGRAYSLIVCSFALHLLEPSRLPGVCYALARLAPTLLVLTPHKRPHLRPEWAWQLMGEFVEQRVRARVYRNN
jgi:SAM-dependent methyltransferase